MFLPVPIRRHGVQRTHQCKADNVSAMFQTCVASLCVVNYIRDL